jgi:methionyl-tRNA formyltransferase
MRVVLVTTGDNIVSRRLQECEGVELVDVFDFAREPRADVDAIRRFVESRSPDLAILYKVPFILPEEVIYGPPFGMINIHPSLLPKYRGLNPWHEILANGETETGVTIHRVDKYADHGEILAQRSFAITPEDNLSTLMAKSEQLGWILLHETLPLISTSVVESMNSVKSVFR